MTNIQLKYVNGPEVHAQKARNIQANRDETKTGCGITLPTQILQKTLKKVTCPLCKKAGA